MACVEISKIMAGAAREARKLERTVNHAAVIEPEETTHDQACRAIAALTVAMDEARSLLRALQASNDRIVEIGAKALLRETGTCAD